MICKYCGNPVSAKAEFCSMCGRPLIDIVEKHDYLEKKQKKVMKRAPFALFTVFLVVSILSCMVVEQSAVLYPEKYTDGVSQCFLKLSSMLPAVLTLLYCFFCVRRRIRDIGKNPSYSLLVMMPIVGQIYLIYLCFKRSVPASCYR